MRSLTRSFAFAPALAAALSLGWAAAPADARSRQTGEERLASLIEGRTAGEPRSCIYMPGNRNLTIIDKTAIVYRDGRRVWVNRTAHPRDIDEDDILVIRKFNASSLCRSDLITTADRLSGMFSGAIFLGDFVPYEKTG